MDAFKEPFFSQGDPGCKTGTGGTDKIPLLHQAGRCLLIRPLFLHHEDDLRCYTEQFEYLLGEDVLVAPVWQAAQETRTVYLPEGEWIHLWTGREYGRGEHTVPAPLGFPPVFWKKGSRWASLMEDIRAEYGAAL